MAKITKEKANEVSKVDLRGDSRPIKLPKRLDICHNSVRRILMRNKEEYAEEQPGGRPRRLVKIDGKLTSEMLVRILEDALQGSIEDWGMGKNDFVLPKHLRSGRNAPQVLATSVCRSH
ncbi:hypothetical protein BGZ65_003785 [Modicella reniformis]|uniref:Uncharacterized protein n=1 Tax=Modicella reniformis TaxID=1440133 RepID=A0A9P6M959_9FUNG|nr:hypothetical protein BGZ65_003785 [Modicella reniformis]